MLGVDHSPPITNDGAAPTAPTGPVVTKPVRLELAALVRVEMLEDLVELLDVLVRESLLVLLVGLVPVGVIADRNCRAHAVERERRDDRHSEPDRRHPLQESSAREVLRSRGVVVSHCTPIGRSPV